MKIKNSLRKMPFGEGSDNNRLILKINVFMK